MRVMVVANRGASELTWRRALELDGHVLAVVPACKEALAFLNAAPAELILLDLEGQGAEGMRLLTQISARFSTTPVLVLSGREKRWEPVRCLESGADDVMAQPLLTEELCARVRALGRRRSKFGERVLRFADLEMDRAERRVTRAGGALDLTSKEFSLLESLLRRRGERVCSRRELLEEVWSMPNPPGHRKAATNIVEVYINYLRRKLGGGRGQPSQAGRSLIRTVRGEGYLLDVEVAAGCGTMTSLRIA